MTNNSQPCPITFYDPAGVYATSGKRETVLTMYRHKLDMIECKLITILMFVEHPQLKQVILHTDSLLLTTTIKYTDPLAEILFKHKMASLCKDVLAGIRTLDISPYDTSKINLDEFIEAYLYREYLYCNDEHVINSKDHTIDDYTSRKNIWYKLLEPPVGYGSLFDDTAAQRAKIHQTCLKLEAHLT